MKNLKLLAICVVALVVGFGMTGCKSMQLDYLEDDTVSGPEMVRQGTAINPRDITVWGIYKDGTRKVVSVGQGNINFNSHTPGRQEVKVRVGVITNQEVSFWTEVVALRQLSVTSPPRTVIYKEGQDPDPRWPGLEIQGEWDKMGAAPIDISSFEITGYDRNQVGNQTVSFAFEGLTANVTVSVRRMTLQIVQQPTKREYLQGETLDLTGLRVNGVWEGLPSEEQQITSSDVTGYNPNTVGNQTLTITKRPATVTFTVNTLGLTSFTITQFPTKLTYKPGEEFDLEGIELTGNYTGSSTTQSRTAAISNDRIVVSNYDPNIVGRQNVRISVQGAANNVFQTIPVTVQP